MFFNTIQDGLFRDCSRMGGAKRPPLLKICCTNHTVMKLGTLIPLIPKGDPKTIWITWHVPLVLLTSTFLPEITKFCYIKKYKYRFHLDTKLLTLLTFLESLRIVLINVVKIMMMSAKMATSGLLEIKILWKKVMTPYFLPMTSQTKFYHVIQIIM